MWRLRCADEAVPSDARKVSPGRDLSFIEETLVKTTSAFRRALIGAAFFALVPLVAQAQTSPGKSPPRLPPNVSETDRIPAGVDTGSPTTSANVPLGTPVPPGVSSDRVDQRTRSAAARAAARPDPLTRTGKPLAPAAPFVSDAVIREASRPTGRPAQRDGSSYLSCDSKDDPAFRNSMSQCTSLTDRSARSACVEQVMARRGCV
jgi:hypothetical protein